MNNMPMDQSQLLDWINQVSFVAYDTALLMKKHFPSITTTVPCG